MKRILPPGTIAAICALLYAATLTAQTTTNPYSGAEVSLGGRNTAWASHSDATASKEQYKQPALPKHEGTVIKKAGNFTSFTPTVTGRDQEISTYNPGFENDPELGVLFADAPCTNCYELLGKRTETQKYFVQKGTQATHFILQSSSVPLHYKDAAGRWATISDRLNPATTGVFSTTGRKEQITVNTAEGYTRIAGPAGSFTYNHNLQLLYINAAGQELPLGKANWKTYTTGDNGMRVKNIWPGIDMEITVLISSIETDFIVTAPNPAYAGGKLVIRDHMLPGNGLGLDVIGNTPFAGDLTINASNGEGIFQLKKAVAYERDNKMASMQDINYHPKGNNVVDIDIPGSLMNKAASAYPVVIDPLLVSSTAAGGGFTYYPAPDLTYCINTNTPVIPAAATLTDITASYAMTGIVGSYNYEPSVRFAVNNTCPSYSHIYCSTWTPNGLSGTACGFTNWSFWSTSGLDAEWGTTPGCLPAFNCSSYSLSFQMYSSQSNSSTSACAQTVFASSTPFSLSIYGTTPVATSISGSSGVCVGSTLVLTGTPSGGTWVSSNTAAGTVSTSGVVAGIAAGTTNITYTITGACTNAVKTVSVDATPIVAAITGATRVCVNSTTTLADATAGGVWTSSATGTATVSGGVVTGVASGTVAISYSFTNSCATVVATKIMTIDPLPAIGTITGTTGICTGTTVTLADAATGGTWVSGSTGIATVPASVGAVHGVATGTSLITYTTTNTYCSATATTTVTVSVLPVVTAISGTAHICQAAAITFTDATAGGSWTSTAPAVAAVGTSGAVTGVGAGAATISYTLANSCATVAATYAVTVDPIFTGGIMSTISTIAGTGITGHTGDGGLATAARIYPTYNIAIDTAQNIYIADSVGDVRKINAAGIISNFLTGYNVGRMAGDNLGNVYFLETSGGNINKFSMAGVITPIYASGGNLSGLCADHSGNIYVSFFDFNSIYRFDATATPIQYAGSSSISYDGDGGQALVAGLGHWVQGLAMDAANNLFIATSFPSGSYERVRKVNADGIISTHAGIPGNRAFSGDGGLAVDAEFNQPYSLITDLLGNLYIVDYVNNRVRKVDVNTGIVNTIAGTGLTNFNGDGIAATSANVVADGLVADRSGSLIIADAYNHRIRKITNVAGSITGSAGVCVGSTITLSDSFYPTYSSWSSSNAAVATVSSAGVVTGVSAGTVVITYMVSNSCNSLIATKSITITALPVSGTLTGPSEVCESASITLINSASFGTFTSTAPGTATVNASGVVTGIAAGTTIISYTVTNACGTVATTANITVNTTPDAGSIAGDATTICVGGIANLSDPVTGGTWGSAGSNISVSADGIATGLALGTDTATYLVTNTSCSNKAKYAITVSCTEGVNDIQSNAGMQLTPNPTPGAFTVFITAPVTEAATVVITNVTGEKITSFTTRTNKPTKVSLNAPSGIYFISASTAHDHYTAKVVLTR